MDEKSSTTRSMEYKANVVKRFVITLLKLFRFCGKKKHPLTDVERMRTLNLQEPEPRKSILKKKTTNI